MKIAMLVHNSVVSDARVIKEAQSLSKFGHEVTVFGYGRKNYLAPTIEGCQLILAEPIRAHILFDRIERWWRSITKFWRELFVERGGSKVYLLGTTGFIALVFLGWSFVWGLYQSGGEFKLALAYPILISTVVLDVFFLKMGVLSNVVKSFARLVGNIFGATKNRFKTVDRHIRIAKRIADSVDVEEFDVIHAHDLIAAISISFLKKRKAGLKVVWDAHELYPELRYKTPKLNRFAKKIISQISARVDAFITINDSFIKYYRENFPGLPTGTVLMNATRRGRPVQSGQSSSPLRLHTGIDSTQMILLFQGGVAGGRGIDVLVEVAYKLPHDWSIVVMGDGGLSKLVDDAVSELLSTRPLNRPAITRIPPAPHSELQAWTSGADLGIIPYRNTGLNHFYCTPNKLWEFPNAGVPILATGLPEMHRMITTYGTGFLLSENFTSDEVVAILKRTSRESLRPFVDACVDFNTAQNWEKECEPRLRKVYEAL